MVAPLEKFIVVVVVEMLMHTMEEQGVLTVEVLASRRNLGDSSNSGCKCGHMVY